MDTIQKIHFELLKTITSGNISGKKIVADLLAHPGLWNAVIDNIKLRIDPGEEPAQYWRLEGIFLFVVLMEHGIDCSR